MVCFAAASSWRCLSPLPTARTPQASRNSRSQSFKQFPTSPFRNFFRHCVLTISPVVFLRPSSVPSCPQRVAHSLRAVTGGGHESVANVTTVPISTKPDFLFPWDSTAVLIAARDSACTLLLSCLVLTFSLASAGAGQAPVQTNEAPLGAAWSAGQTFRASCAGCHAAGGNIIKPGAGLSLAELSRNGYEDAESIYQVTSYGKGRMPGFGEDCSPRGSCTFGPRLTESEIRQLADFVLQRAGEGWQNE